MKRRTIALVGIVVVAVAILVFVPVISGPVPGFCSPTCPPTPKESVGLYYFGYGVLGGGKDYYFCTPTRCMGL